MDDLLTLVLAFTATVVVVLVCFAWAVVHSLRVRNRVSPRVRTRAPLSWLWSWRAAPRLHRRLRRSVLATRSGLPAWLADLAAEVESRAVALDAELVAADRAPMPARARLIAGLRDEVAEVEALDQRLVSMARARRGDLAAVRERLDALDAALRELEPPSPTTA